MRSSLQKAFEVCHIEVDSAVHHYIHHIAVEEDESIDIGFVGVGVVDNRHYIPVEEGEDRNFAVEGSSCLAGVGTAAVEEDHHNLPGILHLGILTF